MNKERHPCSARSGVVWGRGVERRGGAWCGVVRRGVERRGVEREGVVVGRGVERSGGVAW